MQRWSTAISQGYEGIHFFYKHLAKVFFESVTSARFPFVHTVEQLLSQCRHVWFSVHLQYFPTHAWHFSCNQGTAPHGERRCVVDGFKIWNIQHCCLNCSGWNSASYTCYIQVQPRPSSSVLQWNQMNHASCISSYYTGLFATRYALTSSLVWIVPCCRDPIHCCSSMRFLRRQQWTNWPSTHQLCPLV